MQLKSKQELLRTAWDDQIAKNKVMREIMNSEEKLKNNWHTDTEGEGDKTKEWNYCMYEPKDRRTL